MMSRFEPVLSALSFFRWVLVGTLVLSAVVPVALARWCMSQMRRRPG